ncbi:MAG: acyl-CoA dehydrogenase [Propionibacteriales bacterium]|nr:acyl-CoA dehydrogenase [Propionibacteriales bacterium]
MEFEFSDRVKNLRQQVCEFMEGEVLPAEATYHAQIAEAGHPHFHPPVMEELKAKARAAGLWNLFMPDPQWGPGLSNAEYAPLAELMGWSRIGAEAFNCSAPDTGNMEVLARYGTRRQQERWLVPLLEGEIRSCFSMTEPEVASSDATNIRASIVRDGDEYVLNGRKWWSSGGMQERCKLSIFMGKTDPDAERHRQQSMVLVPFVAPGIEVVRNLEVFGYADPEGHAEVLFTDVRVPVDHILVGEGEGFAIAQGRLGPGRIHHCMRLIGAAERALTLMTRRAAERETFGQRLINRQTIQEWIARSRIELEQARMLVLKAAWMMDTVGNKGARQEIAMIKIVAPDVALAVIDRAIQTFGAAGVSQDTPLAELWAYARVLRLADGPNEVHLMSVARQETKRQLAGPTA